MIGMGCVEELEPEAADCLDCEGEVREDTARVAVRSESGASDHAHEGPEPGTWIKGVHIGQWQECEDDALLRLVTGVDFGMSDEEMKRLLDSEQKAPHGWQSSFSSQIWVYDRSLLSKQLGILPLIPITK